MNRTFLWEAKRMARDWASEYMDAHDVPASVSADEFIELAFDRGSAERELKRVAARFQDQAYDHAVRSWTASYRKQRGIRSINVDELLALGSQERGTNPGVTKTKLRKAAGRLAAGSFSATSVA